MIPVAPVLPGETLAGKYKVERILGQGGMGVVVAARHLELDERVAIKFLVGELSPAAVDRFLREARAAVKVKGEHVCRVFDFGRLETDEPYIVMEHLEGTDLARKLEREGPQPVPLVVGWIIEACDALAEAHALGIVHRDLKPANVFLAERPDGSSCAKVLDFGISKLPSVGRMTRTAATMGSPVYMSPEQLESSRDVDARSDVWSLGVMLYELVAGKPPFAPESIFDLAAMIREKEPTPIEDAPPELSRAIAKCLAKRADERYASVAELVRELAPLAPPEISGLVARLVRRTAPSELALQSTARADDGTRASAPAARVEPTSTGDLARRTLAPLQTTMDDRPPAGAVRRWPLVLGALGGIAVLVLVARSMSSGDTQGAIALDADLQPRPVASPANAQLDASVTSTVTTAEAPSAAPSQASVLATSIGAGRASSPPAVVRTAAALASAPDASVASTPTVSATAPEPPPTRSAVDGRKRRELDREDP